MRAGGGGLTFRERKLDGDEIAADLLLQLVPTGGAGPRGVIWADATESGLRFSACKIGPKRQRRELFEKSAAIHGEKSYRESG